MIAWGVDGSAVGARRGGRGPVRERTTHQPTLANSVATARRVPDHDRVGSRRLCRGAPSRGRGTSRVRTSIVVNTRLPRRARRARGVSPALLARRVGYGGDQAPLRDVVLFTRGEHRAPQDRGSVRVLGVHVGAPGDQKARHLGQLLLGRKMPRRESMVVASVDVGAGLQQQPTRPCCLPAPRNRGVRPS